MAEKAALTMEHITKSFSGVKALDDVSFSVDSGEIHALVGENGAGKSTLMKILSGAYPASSYSGKITVFGKNCSFMTPRDAEMAEISIIHQELMVLDELSISENIFIGHLPKKGIVVNWNEVDRLAKETIAAVGMDVDVRTKVGKLGIGHKQLTEIAKALSRKSKILILDEPTAALTDKESRLLFDVLLRLKQNGITIIYISHRMAEVFELSDRISVLRDGKLAATKKKDETDFNEIISLMVGRELGDFYPPVTSKPGAELLSVENFSVWSAENKKVVENASFHLRSGEIVGFSGLLGSGRTELLSAVFGCYNGKSTGNVKLKGKDVSIKRPADAIQHGIGFITEDRKQTGLIVENQIGMNITLTIFKKVAKSILLNRMEETSISTNQIESLKIKAQSANQMVSSLSGGNQQKVVIAKWLTTNPSILVMDEPTRGVDVGAKSEIYKIMRMLAESGVGIVMISSDLPEVLGMSDRIYVMHEGVIAGELTSDQASEQRIMELATGVAVSYK